MKLYFSLLADPAHTGWRIAPCSCLYGFGRLVVMIIRGVVCCQIHQLHSSGRILAEGVYWKY
uniref:Uncharacterized protein n=1 Tax=Arundo donax TaxID=35708 RepID=A0A0A9N6K9_ARUDO